MPSRLIVSWAVLERMLPADQGGTGSSSTVLKMDEITPEVSYPALGPQYKRKKNIHRIRES